MLCLENERSCLFKQRIKLYLTYKFVNETQLLMKFMHWRNKKIVGKSNLLFHLSSQGELSANVLIIAQKTQHSVDAIMNKFGQLYEHQTSVKNICTL